MSDPLIMLSIHANAETSFRTGFVDGFPGASYVALGSATLHLDGLPVIQRLRRTLEELEAKYRLIEEKASIVTDRDVRWVEPHVAEPDAPARFRVPGDLMPDGTVVPEVAGVSIRRMSDVVADWDSPAGAGHDVEADRG